MLLELSKTDEITFADRKLQLVDVLNAGSKYKICVRFDCALELVDSNITEEFFISDPKFNWNLNEKFNVLAPKDYSDGLDKKFAFFVGNSSLLKTSMLRNFKYQFVECDYIEGIEKERTISNTILELITDKRSNDKIGYCVRRNHGSVKKDLCSIIPPD